MINISEKQIVRREAVASGKIRLKGETINAIKEGRVKKGDVFTSAKISALEGVKEAWQRMPYCHQIPIEAIDFDMEVQNDHVTVRCSVEAEWKTGVEMDALSGVSSSLLTVWDMVKYMEKDEAGNYPSTVIYDIKVDQKVKGDGSAQRKRI